MKRNLILMVLMILSVGMFGQVEQSKEIEQSNNNGDCIEVKGVGVTESSYKQSHAYYSGYKFKNNNPFQVTVEAELWYKPEKEQPYIVNTTSIVLDEGKEHYWKTGANGHYIRFKTYKCP